MNLILDFPVITELSGTYDRERMTKLCDNFSKHYAWVKNVDCSEPVKVKPVEERKCRFCNSKDQVFEDDRSHLLPASLGNHEYYSDFECKSCNQRFGKNETHLTYFLNCSRVLTMTKGRKDKVKNFTSKDVTINNAKFRDNDRFLVVDSNNKNSLPLFDKETNSFTIPIPINPYHKFSVYKSLCKMALSVIDEKDLENYSEAIKLLDDNAELSENNLASIVWHQHKSIYFFEKPAISIFKKRRSQSPIVEHIFLLYFQDNIIQFSLTGGKRDASFYDKGVFGALISPPVLYTLDNAFENTAYFIDLMDNEKETTRVDKMILSMDEKQLNNTSRILPDGTLIDGQKFSSGEHYKLILIPKDKTFTKEELPVFIEDIHSATKHKHKDITG